MTVKPHRRTLLRLGIASAAVLALGGGLIAAIKPGLQGGVLSADASSVVQAIGRAVLHGSLPMAADAQNAEMAGLVVRVNDLIAALPAHAQAELSQLLALLGSAGGRMGLAGLSTAWADASVSEITAALGAMQTSRISLKQQAVSALRDMVCGAYFAAPHTWKQLGYPGPPPV